MKQSLIQLCKEGKSLARLDVSEIHYPVHGAQFLGTMEQNHFWFTSRRSMVSNWLKDQKGKMGLEIGCGTGFTAVVLSESGFPTIGIDAHDSFAHYRDSGRGTGFLVGNIFSIDPTPEFDFVLMLDVIEHVEKDEEFLRQAMKFLKPGGVMMISVPALQSLWSEVDDQSGHFRRYSKKEMREKFANIEGARIEKQSYFYASTLPLYFLSRFGRRSRQDISKKESTPPAALNAFLKLLLRMESSLTKFGGFPAGSSLFTLVRKFGDSETR